jgi:hypothetical protein
MTTTPSELLPFGTPQTKAMLNLQKDLMELYEQSSRAWLDRAKSEMELWSGLANKLTGTRSVPEAMEAYQNCVTEQMQIAGAFNAKSNGNTASRGNY